LFLNYILFEVRSLHVFLLPNAGKRRLRALNVPNSEGAVNNQPLEECDAETIRASAENASSRANV